MYNTLITFADDTELYVPDVLAESPEEVTDVILNMHFDSPVTKVVVIHGS